MGKRWFVTSHAQYRASTRFGIITNRTILDEISQALDSDTKLFIRKRNGADVYEIPFLGKTAIAVCDVENRIVLTLIDPKSFYTNSKKLKVRSPYNLSKPKDDDDWNHQERWSS